ncbi:hypothetical protein GJ496_007086 [Pomphorhynchus laevis]|nr:hypothetical protein GJ496_007086 [Pomphorhynchus laevis]
MTDLEGVRTVSKEKVGRLGIWQVCNDFNFFREPCMLLYTLNFLRVQLVLIGHRFNITGQTSSHPNVTVIEVNPNVPFGTHHSKMIILKFNDSIRIAIMTGNFIFQDWYQKTQGVWLSPFLDHCDSTVSTTDSNDSDLLQTDSTTNFRFYLTAYLKEYKKNELSMLADLLQEYNFRSIRAHFIASAPGRRKRTSVKEFGLPRMQSIFPTVKNIANSLEGYSAGHAFPYSYKTHLKQQYILPYFSLVRAAIFSFPSTSASGCLRLRPEHLQDLLTSDLSGSFLQRITSLVNTLLDGGGHESVARYLCGANLIALVKEPDGVRPIAVGETLRRLCSKCACRKLSTVFLSVLQPTQLGIHVLKKF